MKAGWEVKPLGEVCNFENGDRGKNYPGKKCFVASGVPFINAGLVDDGEILWDDMNFIPENRFELLSRGKIQTGDFLFCLRGSLGKFGHYVSDRPAAIASSLVIIRPIDEVLPSFFAYYLRSAHCASEIERLAAGAAQPNLGANDLKTFSIPIPPLEEQKRIVAVLDAAFEGLTRAKENAEANLQNARELFERRMARAFHKVANAGGAVSKTVAEIAYPQKGTIRTGPFGSQLLHSEFTDEGIAVLGIDNAVKNEFQWGKSRFISPEKYEALRRYTVKPGDVIITIMGTCGRCAVVPNDIPVAINTKHLCCITLDPKGCLPSYLHAYFLHSEASLEYLAANASGSVMDGLNMGLIKELPVYLPSLGEQEAIAKLYADAKANLIFLETNYRTKLTDFADLRQSLLQKAFAGELT